MSLFQLAGIGFAATIVALLIWGVVCGKALLRNAAPWIAVWSAVGALLTWPESTAVVARTIGVERGADLVSYVAILAALVGFFVMSIRIRHLNRNVTLLVREVALQQVAGDAGGEGPGEGSGDDAEAWS